MEADSVEFQRDKSRATRALIIAAAVETMLAYLTIWALLHLDDNAKTSRGAVAILALLLLPNILFVSVLFHGIPKLLKGTPFLLLSPSGITFDNFGLVPWKDIISTKVVEVTDQKTGKQNSLLGIEIQDLKNYARRRPLVIKCLTFGQDYTRWCFYRQEALQTSVATLAATIESYRLKSTSP